MTEVKQNMPFVHSLVKTQPGKRPGWCAPSEVKGAMPSYVSFLIPVHDATHRFPKYFCELVAVGDGENRLVTSHEMLKVGKDSYSLRVNGAEFWFVERPVSRQQRCLPYLGKLSHEDFQFLLVEIMPEDHSALDQLCADSGQIIIGCDPFTHYAGMKTLNRLPSKRIG